MVGRDQAMELSYGLLPIFALVNLYAVRLGGDMTSEFRGRGREWGDGIDDGKMHRPPICRPAGEPN